MSIATVITQGIGPGSSIGAVILDGYVSTTGAYVLTAETGSYTLSGQDADLLFNRLLTADVGAYTVAGQDANLIRGYTLVAETGGYVYTGQDAALLFNRVLTADPGAYTLVGYDANLTRGFTLVAEAGSYTISGQDASFLYNRVLNAEIGAYNYTGYAAVFVYSGQVRFVYSNTEVIQDPTQLFTLQPLEDIQIITSSDSTAAIQSNKWRN